MTVDHLVQISSPLPGRHRIVVDGRDVSAAVTKLEMVVEHGAVPAVVLHARQGATDFEGLAQVKVAVYDYADAVATFLGAIDPEALQDAALNRFDLDTSEVGLTKAMLTQLIEWANGRA